MGGRSFGRPRPTPVTPGLLSDAPKLLAPVATVYDLQLDHHGIEARGVLWRNEENQRMRFEVLAGIIEAEDALDFRSKAVDWARTFCPPGRASGAIGLIKRAVQTGGETSMDVGLALERELQQRLFKGEDAAEGIRAYNEKRKPQFSGR